jgi:hypothetical protein
MMSNAKGIKGDGSGGKHETAAKKVSEINWGMIGIVTTTREKSDKECNVDMTAAGIGGLHKEPIQGSVDIGTHPLFVLSLLLPPYHFRHTGIQMTSCLTKRQRFG